MGVTLLAGLAVLDGAFDALSGWTLVRSGNEIAAHTVFSGGMVTLVGMVLLVIAVLLLALGYGLWMMRPWAWTLGVGLESANILLALARFAGGRETIAGALLTLMIAGTILYYLLQPPVRADFGRS
jgi:uncharacterized membrane protein (DUF2068 family)